MNAIEKRIHIERKVLLSTLWLFAVINYLYCDVVQGMDPVYLKQYLTGTVNGMDFSQGFLLAAAILMEIPILMVLLSRVLSYKPNRWVNFGAGLLMALVQAASLFAGAPASYYAFCSVFEITATGLIAFLALTWREEKALES